MNDDTFYNVSDNLANLLNTEPGDRLFHPKLGVNFRKHLFNQMDNDIEEFSIIIKEDIEKQVSIWMPFLQILKVEVLESVDKNTYRIKVDFSFIKNPALLGSVEKDLPSGVY